MKEQLQIDSILTTIENPIRRRIIKRLSQEPSYPLEISKELGIGQQLVAAHLAIMERNGIVASNMETSPLGPKRRLYFLKQSACLTVSFGPHLFNERVFTFETLPPTLSTDTLNFLSRITGIRRNWSDNIMGSLSELIADLDEKLLKVEEEKTALLYLRNLAMKQASEILSSQKREHDEKRILHFILDERSIDIGKMSMTLNLRESTIREILEKIRHTLPPKTEKS